MEGKPRSQSLLRIYGQIIIRKMSLTNKDSDVSQNLRKLLLAFRQNDEIDLTPYLGAPFLIRHVPEECPTCKEAYQQVRNLGRANPDLFDEDGYVNEEVLVTIGADQQQRLHETAQRLDTHLKQFREQEQERLTKKAAERGRFQW